MLPQSNWQFLLLSQIHRGAYFMHPRMVMGMAPVIDQLLDKSTPTIVERADYQLQAFAFNLSGIDQSDISADTHGTQESIYDEVPAGSTAVFRIAGTLLKYGTLCEYGTEEIAAFIGAAANHDNIGSIVLDIDSGGGSVSAIAPLLQVIKRAQSKGVAVVASIDMCCSAALYVAAQCNQIIATNNISSEIGSIGVMVSFWDVAPHYEKEGFKQHTIYATQSTEKNQSFELALKGEYDMIKAEMLDPLAIQFQQHMISTRAGKLDESVPGILAGKTFFADKALQYGLIDDIGDLSFAINRAQQIATVNSFSNS